MKNYILFLLCIFSLIYTACRKENTFKNTIISGIVKDSTSDQVISGVNVELYRWKSSGLWNTYNKKIDLQSTNTDSNGQWNFEFRQVSGRVYNLSFLHQDYYGKIIQFGDNEAPEPVIYLVPTGTIEIRLTKDTLNAYDKIHMEIINPYSINTNLTLCDEYLPETRTFDAIGGTANILLWTLYSDPDCMGGFDTTGVDFSDTIWVNPGENVVYELSY